MFSVPLPKFLQRDKKKAAVKEEVSTLNELLKAEAKYSTKPIPIEDGLFRKIRDEIKEAVERCRPSGANGRLAQMSGAISAILEQHGVSQDQYWGEVWRRAGQRSMIEYNKPSGPMAQASPAADVGPGAKISVK